MNEPTNKHDKSQYFLAEVTIFGSANRSSSATNVVVVVVCVLGVVVIRFSKY